MKKILCLVLALILLACGCGQKEEPKPIPTSTVETVEAPRVRKVDSRIIFYENGSCAAAILVENQTNDTVELESFINADVYDGDKLVDKIEYMVPYPRVIKPGEIAVYYKDYVDEREFRKDIKYELKPLDAHAKKAKEDMYVKWMKQDTECTNEWREELFSNAGKYYIYSEATPVNETDHDIKEYTFGMIILGMENNEPYVAAVGINDYDDCWEKGSETIGKVSTYPINPEEDYVTVNFVYEGGRYF